MLEEAYRRIRAIESGMRLEELAPVVSRWAPYALAINGIAGIVVVVVNAWVAVSGMPYEVLSVIAGRTIWSKLLLGFALSRHGHGLGARKKA